MAKPSSPRRHPTVLGMVAAELNRGADDMKCAEVRCCLVDYMEDDLDPAAVDRLLRHIDSCAACQSVLEGLRNVTALLGLFSEFEMPDELPRLRLDLPDSDLN